MKTKTPPEPLLITRDALAAKLSLSPERLRRLTLEGKIPCVRLGHKTVRYDVAKVMAAIAKFEVKASA